jgi:hypothetical protein
VLDGDAVRTTVAAMRDLLDRVRDAEAPVPVMDCTVAAVADHLASCLAFYAHDLASGPDEVTANDLVRRTGVPLRTVATSVTAWGEVLARVVDSTPPDQRGWHSHGVADPAGFAAIGCAEVLVHGTDIAEATGLSWSPPAVVAAAVLARLFPEVPPRTPP